MELRHIAWSNLRRRKSRMAFLVAGLLLGVATVVTLTSLVGALSTEAEHELDKFGANILITPQTENLSLSYGGLDLGGVTVAGEEIDQASLGRLQQIPNRRNIAAVAPKVLGAVNAGEERVLLMGVEPEVEFGLKRWWQLDGRPPAGPGELVAGNIAAQRLGLEPGDAITLAGESFSVVGILGATGSQDDQLLIAELGAAQSLLGKEGRLSLVEVAALCGDCPVEDMVRQIAAVLPGAKVTAIQQVVKSRMHALDQFRALSLAVGGVVLLIGGLVVFVTMMNAVSERTREIGIFRAIGFRRRHVMQLLLMEAAVVSLVAGIFGYLAGSGITRLTLPFFSAGEAGHAGHHAPAWDPTLAVGAVLLSLAVGAAATLYPAWKASRLEPGEALRTL